MDSISSSVIPVNRPPSPISQHGKKEGAVAIQEKSTEQTNTGQVDPQSTIQESRPPIKSIEIVSQENKTKIETWIAQLPNKDPNNIVEEIATGNEKGPEEVSLRDTLAHLKNIGADVNKQNDEGWTPVIIAAGMGQVKFIKALLQGLSDEDRITYLNKANKYGYTPLYVAVCQKQAKVIKVLLEGLSPKDRLTYLHMAHNDGDTPLYIAAQNGHVEVITELLKDLTTEERLTYLHMATKHGVTPLYIAAQNGHVEVITELLKGLEKDQRLTCLHKANNDGVTPLYIAAQNGHLNVIKELLKDLTTEERLTYLHMATKHGFTPILIAEKNGHLEVVQELVRAGDNLEEAKREAKKRADHRSAMITKYFANRGN